MKLHILFIQRVESYPGEHAPEALAVIDEFALSEIGEAAWTNMKTDALADNGTVAGSREVVVEVSSKEIRELVYPIVKPVQGTVEGGKKRKRKK